MPCGQTNLIVVLAIALALTVTIWLFFGNGTGQGTTVVSKGPTVAQLERLGELVALKVYVADVLVAEGEECRGSWLIKGDALISVDLKKATIANKDEKKRHATIILPPPKVLQPREDHEKTRAWDISKVTWISFRADPDKLRDSAMLQAQKLVESAAHLDEAMDAARENAALIVKNMYRLVEWDIDVTWSDKTGK